MRNLARVLNNPLFKHKNTKEAKSWEAERVRGGWDGRAEVERRSGIPFDSGGELQEEIQAGEAGLKSWVASQSGRLNKIFTSHLFYHLYVL